MERCENCRYWHEPIGGACRRSAPRTTHFSEMSDWRHPHCHPDDWCGEWRETVEAQAARVLRMAEVNQDLRTPSTKQPPITCDVCGIASSDRFSAHFASCPVGHAGKAALAQQSQTGHKPPGRPEPGS